MTGTISEQRVEMRKKARAIRGIATVLQDDAEYIHADAESFDLVSLTEAIREAKDTVNLLIDHIVELEYLVYLAKGNIGGDEYGPESSVRY